MQVARNGVNARTVLPLAHMSLTVEHRHKDLQGSVQSMPPGWNQKRKFPEHGQAHFDLEQCGRANAYLLHA
jgi:hypothetical protein